jgi:hypothetical protein
VKIWTFIDAHHKKLGAALFVIPVVLFGMVLVGLGYGVLLLFG